MIEERGAIPKEIVLDNGPELTSRALDQWAYAHRVRLRFIDRGKAVQNAYTESFNRRFRDECRRSTGASAQPATGVSSKTGT